MKGWILWEIGKGRLQEAGLKVEREKYRLAVRLTNGVFPTFLTINNGRVSERRVEQVIKKHKADLSG